MATRSSAVHMIPVAVAHPSAVTTQPPFGDIISMQR
jgi:hypothetical protein